VGFCCIYWAFQFQSSFFSLSSIVRQWSRCPAIEWSPDRRRGRGLLRPGTLLAAILVLPLAGTAEAGRRLAIAIRSCPVSPVCRELSEPGPVDQ
jgi:hypothetical protein